MTTTPTPAHAPDEPAGQAAALDALLVGAALGRLRWFTPDGSTVKLAAGLASHPWSTGRRLGHLAGEMMRVAAGRSMVGPSRRHRRFTDPAWSTNPLLRRVVQAYLATGSLPSKASAAPTAPRCSASAPAALSPASPPPTSRPPVRAIGWQRSACW